MSATMPRGKLPRIAFFMPFVVMAADYLLHETGVARIRAGLAAPGAGIVWTILIGYVLYIAALPVSGLLHPLGKTAPPTEGQVFPHLGNDARPPAFKWEMLLLYLGAGFGVIVVLLLVHALGLTSDVKPAFTDGQQMAVIMTGSVLVIIHISLVLYRPKPRIYSDRAVYAVALFFILVIGGLAVWLASAGWLHLLGESSPVAREGGKILDMAFAFPIFLLFFAAPRFLFLRRGFNRYAFLFALALTGVFVWESLKYVKIF